MLDLSMKYTYMLYFFGMLHSYVTLFQGGVVLVSHDERLIRLICTEVWVCGDLNVRRVEGGIDEYKKLVQQELAAS